MIRIGNGMNKTFVTSDTHFGHFNIIRYCNRPFTSVSDMNSGLIDRWNASVSASDTVYHLGDFAFLPEMEILEIMRKLKGNKIIVPGNHDKKLLRIWNDPQKYSLDPLPFTITEKIFNLKADGKLFILCHFPMHEWEEKHHGTIHLHGHTHGNSGHHGTPIIENRYDIGVDVFGGPIELTLENLNKPLGWN